MSGRALIGWAACATEIKAQGRRLAALERDSHPPIDLTPLLDELLDARGYAPTITEPHLTPSERLAKLLGEAADALDGERDMLLDNYTNAPKNGGPRDPEEIEEREVYRQVRLYGRLVEGLRAAITELQPAEQPAPESA